MTVIGERGRILAARRARPIKGASLAAVSSKAIEVSDGRDYRITLFLPNLAGGGAQRAMVTLANALAENGIPVDILLVCKDGPFLDTVSSKVRVVDLGAQKAIASFRPLRQYLKRERPIVLISALTAINVVAILTTRLSCRTARVIVTEHSPPTAEFQNAKSPRSRLAYRLMPWVYPLADRIVAVSHGVAQDLARYARLREERIQVIHNPVVSPSLLRLASEAAGHPWFETGQPPVILAVGRLADEKKFDTLLHAFALVRKRRMARLVIAGEGDTRVDLLRLAHHLDVRDDFDLPGFMANPYALMARASVFVVSSAWEGLSNVLIEAMACGTPVVATDCPGGPAEVLEGGRFGRLVPVGDSAALAEAIIKTMETPLAADTLRARACDFTVERSAKRYMAFLPGNQ